MLSVVLAHERFGSFFLAEIDEGVADVAVRFEIDRHVQKIHLTFFFLYNIIIIILSIELKLLRVIRYEALIEYSSGCLYNIYFDILR